MKVAKTQSEALRIAKKDLLMRIGGKKLQHLQSVLRFDGCFSVLTVVAYKGDMGFSCNVIVQ